MKILLTGGTGFLGKRLVGRLLARGHEVICLSRSATDESPGGPRIVVGTLARINDWIDSVGPCDVVIHAAAAMKGGAPVLFLNNVVATRELVKAVPRLGIRRFVLISSLGTYASGHLKAGETLDESTPVDPQPQLRDPYSYSKVAQEQVAWEAHQRGELPLVIIRPGVIYGPGRGCLSGRIGLQLGGVMIKMGGQQRVPYTYVDNCAESIALAATVPGIEGEAFNIIDDNLPTASWVFAQNQKHGKRIRMTVPVPRWALMPISALNERYSRWSEGMIPAVLTRYKSAAMWTCLNYSNAKAKRLLGWKPQVDISDGVRLACGA